MADHLGFLGRMMTRACPGIDQRVDDGIQLLFRRIPGLEEVVVEVDYVDGVDRSIGIGVGGQQNAPSYGIQVHCLFEELDSTQTGHAVVGDDHSDCIAAKFHFTQGLERLVAGLRANDSVLLAVPFPEVSNDGTRNTRIVVDAEDRWFGRGFRCAHSVPSRSCSQPLQYATAELSVNRWRCALSEPGTVNWEFEDCGNRSGLRCIQ